MAVALAATLLMVPEVRTLLGLGVQSQPTTPDRPSPTLETLPLEKSEPSFPSSAPSGILPANKANTTRSDTAKPSPLPQLASTASRAAPSNSAGNPHSPAAVLPDYTTDFSDWPSAWAFYPFASWTETARASVVDDSGRALEIAGGVQWGGGNSVAIVPAFRTADATVTVQARIVEIRNDGHHSAIVARFRDTGNFYELWLNRPSQRAYLTKWTDGHYSHLQIVTLPEDDFHGWIRLALRCVGPKITATVNGHEVINVLDYTHASGTYGVMNAGGVTHFRRFSLSGTA
jgi:hypothetical protein